MLVAPQTPRLAARIGANRVVALGLLLVGGGLLLFTLTKADTPYPVLLVPMFTLATGMGLTMAPLTGSIMSAVPLGKAGVGSAMNDTTRELGGALGVAVLGSLVASIYASDMASTIAALPEQAKQMAETSLSGALHVATQLPGAAGEALADAAKQAYLSGMHLADAVAGVVAIIAAVIVFKLLPSTRPVVDHVRRPVPGRAPSLVTQTEDA
jgi:hypothetical protein